MTLRALIFDVDGTLAETEEAHRRAFNDTFRDAGLDWHWTVQDYTRLLRVTGGKERMRAFRDGIGRGPDDAQIAALHLRKTERYMQLIAQGGLHLRPGVAELIAWGRKEGLRLAIATTTSLPNVQALALACWGRDAAEIFDVIAAGDEVAAKKPAPDVFELALRRLALPVKDCLAFEDSRNGLRAAKAAGLRTIVTPSLYTAHEDFDLADEIRPDLGGFVADLVHV
ncbi:HAD family hydrolase [Tropicibacter naphthalenivorans]|uniref:Phosphorylated carbohydrates phosphatase n=1 Tax=Tropicibacter naphthalenivorans TaxID=441103 RepID=A0A0P1GKK6_9RHOB|nr:HAD family hydrolase [Tropicibacter naphthalenivorans]CUH82438.1 Phosphorylated carbohydrates phosphatase [Tropicibacter naphthalenivorans]SMD06148.1 haloacid dehalogenase superfamily, subfamily IA, variant 3 with third motif having DD or ED [Tropicibacter naphthalenivorans]